MIEEFKDEGDDKVGKITTDLHLPLCTQNMCVSFLIVQHFSMRFFFPNVDINTMFKIEQPENIT